MIVDITTLDIETVKPSQGVHRMVIGPLLPNILTPRRVFQISDKREQDRVFLKHKLTQPLVDLINSTSEIWMLLFHLYQKLFNIWQNYFPEPIIYSLLQTSKLCRIES